MFSAMAELTEDGQPMLKAILDETSFAKYDFMYLRIGRSSNSFS